MFPKRPIKKQPALAGRLFQFRSATDQRLTASFKTLPALNFGCDDAGMLMV